MGKVDEKIRFKIKRASTTTLLELSLAHTFFFVSFFAELLSLLKAPQLSRAKGANLEMEWRRIHLQFPYRLFGGK